MGPSVVNKAMVPRADVGVEPQGSGVRVDTEATKTTRIPLEGKKVPPVSVKQGNGSYSVDTQNNQTAEGVVVIDEKKVN